MRILATFIWAVFLNVVALSIMGTQIENPHIRDAGFALYGLFGLPGLCIVSAFLGRNR